MSDDALKLALLAAVGAAPEAAGVDGRVFAATVPAGANDYNLVQGALKSLALLNMVTLEVTERNHVEVTPAGRAFVEHGADEFRCVRAVLAAGADGLSRAELDAAIGADAAKAGFAECMKRKWLVLDKASGRVKLQLAAADAAALVDEVAAALRHVVAGEASAVAEPTLQALAKRKLCVSGPQKSYVARRGPAFALLLPAKAATDLTEELLTSGAWASTPFKTYAFETAQGIPPHCGHLHPLLKVRADYRQILLEMGFSEMNTQSFVSSSFWNFDSLFQPQQHPARDAHDTFFLAEPALARIDDEAYMQRVKMMHERGGDGSIGWRYDWSVTEARRNVLRTHTTAVSARVLYEIGQQVLRDGEAAFKPAKFFSVDRVFRNEALDATHLAEFFQIEGIIVDRGLSLSHLIGILEEFFRRIGIEKIRVKAAFNPYTEPSMEVFGFHPGLKKWVEIGNSGMFRPEMLRPMGLPADVRAIAWGLGLERPTMIKYGLNNVRDLAGHKTSLSFVETNPITRLDKD